MRGALDWLGGPAFTAFGVPASRAELLGFVFGALCVWLVARQQVLNWPVGIANCLFFIVLFTDAGLYGDASLQIVFILLGLWGWAQWLTGRRGTEETCRADLAAMWPRLDQVVRQGLATRVVVVGAESTGTTTVSRALAQRFRDRGGVWASTGWVPEFGRDFTITKWDEAKEQARAAGRLEPEMTELVWTADDFALIATRQTELENAAAAAGSPLLVCDTDAFATRVWERRYLGAAGSASHEAAGEALPRRDVYLLTDHRGVPFVQDGIRDGEHIRADMTGWFIEALTAAGHSWVLLSGTLEERVDLAVRVADQMLALRSTFAAPPAVVGSAQPPTTPAVTT